MKKNCLKLKEKFKQKNKQPKDTSVASDSDVKGDVLSISSSMDSLSDWILDSDYSCHMCSHRDWFATVLHLMVLVILWGTILYAKLLG